LKIKTSIEELSAVVLETFGAGGFTLEDGQGMKIENCVGNVNTPLLVDIQGDTYIRVRFEAVFAHAVEYVYETFGSEHVDLIRVEWPQEEPYLPFLLEVQAFDEEGAPSGTSMQELGGF
jgi:hypothetical protein